VDHSLVLPAIGTLVPNWIPFHVRHAELNWLYVAHDILFERFELISISRPSNSPQEAREVGIAHSGGDGNQLEPSKRNIVKLRKANLGSA